MRRAREGGAMTELTRRDIIKIGLAAPTLITNGCWGRRHGRDLRVGCVGGLNLRTNRARRVRGRGVRAHGEDGVGRDCGADRALESAWLPQDRALGVRA